jgi:peptidoglycan/xylan/chitin deacetylase (PgdA/CDA1 family)
MTGRRVTLTFDNGPTPGLTEGILDLLADRGIRTTFFTVGTDLVQPGRRDIVERARAEGHWIGNHTLTHSLQFGDQPSVEVAEREIDRAQDILGELSHPDRFFRPWGDGVLSERLLSEAAVDRLVDGGYSLVLWSAIPRDWDDTVGWVDRALEQIAEQEWPLMVVHDIPSGAMDRLPDFLDAALESGVEFRQDFPDDCVPIRRGRKVGSLEGLIS